MAVNLFAVRVVLKALGAVDYGIYNVVGGVVTMFSFISGTMVSASQRFFAFELGRKDHERLKQYFSLTIFCYAIIALIIVILAETVGLWFLRNKLVIPESRQIAAFWVFQFSVAAFIATLFSIPYNSIIIARERMNVYALVSIFEALAKLLIVYLLFVSVVDNLILYAAMASVVAIIVAFIYRIYCKRKYTECRFVWFWNRQMFSELLSFSGWNLFGAVSGVLGNQGINILLNIFFGPAVNAARAIAYQIGSAMSQFVVNFFKAVHPQITKLYAAEKKREMLDLVFLSSRFCFYLMLVLSLPVLLETNFLLTLWLEVVPDHVLIFSRLVIIAALIDSSSYPFMASVQATGKIRAYQAVTGGLLLLSFPVSYAFLKWGFPAVITMYVAVGISTMALVSRVLFMRKLLNMSISDYCSKVACRILVVSLITTFSCFFVFQFYTEGFLRLIISGTCAIIFGGMSVYLFGISNKEKAKVNIFVMTKLRMWRLHEDN